MGFLADLGRTNALAQQTQAISNLALNIRQGQRQDQEYEDNRAVRDLNLNKAKFEFEQARKKAQQDDHFFSVNQMFGAFSPETQELARNRAMQLGFGGKDEGNGDVYIKGIHLPEAQKWLISPEGTKFQMGLEQSELNAIDNRTRKIKDLLTGADPVERSGMSEENMNAKPLKDAEKQALRAELVALDNRRTIHKNSLEMLKGPNPKGNDKDTSWDKVGETPDGKVIYRNKQTGEEKIGTTTVRQEEKDKKGESGLGNATENDFRQYLNDARGAALKTMKFNDPSQLALMLAMVQNPEKADAIGAQLERSMTPEQVQEYRDKIDSYMGDFAPDEVVSEYKRRTSRTPQSQKKIGATPSEDTALGQVNKGIKEPASQQLTPQKETPAKQSNPMDEPGFWEGNLSGLDPTGRRGNLEPVIRAYLSGKMTEEGLRSALDLAGLTEKSVNDWTAHIKTLKK